MKKIQIKTDFIKLGQFLKYIGCITNGCEAKNYLLNNIVNVNNVHEQRRGKKLVVGDQIKIEDEVYLII